MPNAVAEEVAPRCPKGGGVCVPKTYHPLLQLAEQITSQPSFCSKSGFIFQESSPLSRFLGLQSLVYREGHRSRQPHKQYMGVPMCEPPPSADLVVDPLSLASKPEHPPSPVARSGNS